MLLSCLDFWTTKNITGRYLIGLRWWTEGEFDFELADENEDEIPEAKGSSEAISLKRLEMEAIKQSAFVVTFNSSRQVLTL